MKSLYILFIATIFTLSSLISFSAEVKEAHFAGGCFWCIEAVFDKLEGVEGAVSGYAGGDVKHPTYEQVSSGTTGHIETVRVSYYTDIISYEELLEVFWKQIDPTDPDGQFADRGFQYSTAVFYTTEEEKEIFEKTKKRHIENNTFKDVIVIEAIPFTNFYRAEEEHQNYHEKKSIKYKYYRKRSGRDKYLKEIWNQ